jgi:hypothetical protein
VTGFGMVAGLGGPALYSRKRGFRRWSKTGVKILRFF